MCRLYATRANEPTKVECSLVYAQNALLAQSISDQAGRSHADGWGISCYEDGHPWVEKYDTAAHQDERFSLTAERLYAKIVIAHVRRATVGKHSRFNSHPFTYGPWTFAHNGTLKGFGQLESELAAETDADLLARRKGETDSEMIFYWLLTRMRRLDGSGEIPEPRFDQVTGLLCEAIPELDRRSDRTDSPRTTRLNFLLSDGRSLFATRLRNPLHGVVRDGIRDCEICGIPHVHHDSLKRYRAVVLASEPISHEDWQEIPDGSVVGVTEDLEYDISPL
jgi:glutamine amidotransferase